MSLRGTLDAFNLSSLLQLLSNDQKTGVLYVANGPNSVKIFMKAGIIVYASSSEENLRMGRLLVNQGEISEEKLRSCLRISKDAGLKLGKTLVRDGAISLDTLKKTLHRQVKEILCSLFLWKTGAFEFRDIPFEVEGKLVTKMNTMEILLEASRRIDEWSVIKEQIETDDQVFAISEKTQGKKDVKLNKTEWRILSLVDGTRTVREIVDKSGHDEFSAFKALCSMKLSGLVEQAKKPRTGRRETLDYATIANIYIDIFQVVQKDMETQLGQSVAVMIDQCVGKVLPQQKALFKCLDMRKEPKATAQGIVEAMAAFKDTAKGRSFLTHSLNTLLEMMLEKQVETLGFQLTQETGDKIRQTLSYVREYREDSHEMRNIIHSVHNILDEVVSNGAHTKKGAGGMLSFLKKGR